METNAIEIICGLYGQFTLNKHQDNSVGKGKFVSKKKMLEQLDKFMGQKNA